MANRGTVVNSVEVMDRLLKGTIIAPSDSGMYKVALKVHTIGWTVTGSSKLWIPQEILLHCNEWRVCGEIDGGH